MMHEDEHAGTSDRRTFLTSAPQLLLDRVKGLMRSITAPPSVGKDITSHRVAILDVSRCLAWGTTGCQLCYLQCPLRDRAMVLEGSKPTVVTSACDGCGVCVEVCRTVNDLGAIEVVSI